MPKPEADPVSSRLDVIIRLLLEKQRKEDKEVTVGDQIVTLESAGLQGKDVARIFGLDVGQLPSYRRSAKKRRKVVEEVEPHPGVDSTSGGTTEETTQPHPASEQTSSTGESTTSS